MRPWWTGWRGAVGAAAGATAATVAAGVAAERYATSRLRGRLDPDVIGRFHESSGIPAAVAADDGVPLYVEVDEPAEDAGPVTLVFCHGWALEHACWFYQRRELGDLGRMVFWDQRCHGRSGRCSGQRVGIDTLGDDLRAVLEAAAPSGPLVLVGHSMGGMTIMAFAERYPHLFAERVAGVALLGTAARGVGASTPGLYGALTRRLAPELVRTLGKAPRPVERVRAMGRLVTHVTTGRLGFGTTPVSQEMVAFVDGMLGATPVDVIADFYPGILAHDRLAALSRFGSARTLVLAGTRDMQISVEASRVIADAVPSAELVELEGSGHLVMLERPAEVNAALRRLVREVGVARRPDE